MHPLCFVSTSLAFCFHFSYLCVLSCLTTGKSVDSDIQGSMYICNLELKEEYLYWCIIQRKVQVQLQLQVRKCRKISGPLFKVTLNFFFKNKNKISSSGKGSVFHIWWIHLFHSKAVLSRGDQL